MPPRRLYKYRSLQGENFRHTQGILTRSCVHCASVGSFNDPFEGHFKLLMPPIAPEAQRQYEAWVNRLSNDWVRREAAVLSLAERRDDLLMWAHYADNHKGICIEFDTTIQGSLFLEAEPVRYLTQFKEVEHGVVRGETELMHLVCTAKAKHWRYEKEWRVIVRGPGNRSFPPQCITGIILGCRISNDDRQWVCEWVANKPIRVYQAIQKQDAFALDIQEVYTLPKQ